MATIMLLNMDKILSRNAHIIKITIIGVIFALTSHILTISYLDPCDKSSLIPLEDRRRFCILWLTRINVGLIIASIIGGFKLHKLLVLVYLYKRLKNINPIDTDGIDPISSETRFHVFYSKFNIMLILIILFFILYKFYIKKV
jgi:hypothetical protein